MKELANRLGVSMGVLCLLGVVPLQAEDTNKTTVGSEVIDIERGTDPGNQAYSDWMYTRRLRDPLASEPGEDPIFFREKQIAIEATVNPDLFKNADMESEFADKNRAKIRAVTRFREIPLEQDLPSSDYVVDLTNENDQYRPKNSKGKSIYFKPMRQPGAAKVDSNGNWVTNGVTITTNDVVMEIPNEMPWEDTGKGITIMDWAKAQTSGSIPASTLNCVIYFDGINQQVSTGGVFNGADHARLSAEAVDWSPTGGIVINVGKITEQVGRNHKGKGLVIAVKGNPNRGGMNRTLLFYGMFLAGPTQIVSDANVVVLGDLGYNPAKGLPVEPWVVTDFRQARWRVLAPNFQICSPWSRSDLLDGHL